MWQKSLRRRSEKLPGIFGRRLWYLVVLICHLYNSLIWKCFKVLALAALWFDLKSIRCRLMKHMRQFSIVSYFNKLTLATLFSFTFSSKFEIKRDKIRAFWEFNVCSWIASVFSSSLHCYIIMFWTCPAISHLTFLISLEILYTNWLLLKLLIML